MSRRPTVSREYELRNDRFWGQLLVGVEEFTFISR
jgi:hypothetical protein